MTSVWDGYALPGGRRLERDPQFGFLRVMPPPSAEETAAFYASAYTNPCLVHDPDGRAELVVDLVTGSGRVLDVGCGRGEMLDAFRRRGWQTVGIEPGREYADQARARGLEVRETVLTDEIAASLGSFDAVLLVHVLEHLPDPLATVQTARRLLRPGGILYCEVPNDFNRLQTAAAATQHLRPWWIAIPDHLNYFSIESLSRFIAAQGFELARVTTDFPVELFLLWGDVYIDNPEAGRAMHQRRCRFEQAMREAGAGDLLEAIYERLAGLGVGREAIVCGRKTT
ncbi:MAG: class I SAM-dependent methyltransferase [Acidobacteria bacterium]|nr:class I SAM-dependent methyltransferase [Acidobacteriota bacterium]